MGAITGTLEVVANPEALAARAAAVIAGRMAGASAAFRLALAGGSTPRRAYELLAGAGLDWHRTEIFFGDERFVAEGDPQSNYGMARRALLDHVRPRGVFPMPTDGDPQGAADRYQDTLRRQYGAATFVPGKPLFHLTLLGLGEDGHTASLLPGQPVLNERRNWVAPVPHGRENQRITLTYPALEASALILFLVAGAKKSAALAQARAGQLPAGALRPIGDVLWLVDRDAAGAGKD